MTPTFSIITVCLNAERTLERTIRSVASQACSSIEHIIVDGGSRDGTVDVIDRHRASLGCVISEPDNGLYDAMNKGIAASKGDIIGILNSDDTYTDDQVLSNVFQSMLDRSIDMCYGDLVYAGPRGVVPRRYWRSRHFSPGLFLTGWMPPHPTLFVRRRVYQTVGSFNTDFSISADYEFMLRALEVHRLRSLYIPRTLVRMDPGGASTRSLYSIVLANWECLQARTRNGLPARYSLLFRKPFAKLLQYGRLPDF